MRLRVCQRVGFVLVFVLMFVSVFVTRCLLLVGCCSCLVPLLFEFFVVISVFVVVAWLCLLFVVEFEFAVAFVCCVFVCVCV